MNTEAFLKHLRAALHPTWEAAGVSPRKWKDYSEYIFGALSKASVAAHTEPRCKGAGGELLYDMVWLPQNGGAYRLPEVVIEHENGVSEEHFTYDLRKLMMGWAPLRVMISYVPVGHEPLERLETLRAVAAKGQWNYPSNCADLVLVGPCVLQTPRDYLVLYRPDGARAFESRGMLADT